MRVIRGSFRFIRGSNFHGGWCIHAMKGRSRVSSRYGTDMEVENLLFVEENGHLRGAMPSTSVHTTKSCICLGSSGTGQRPDFGGRGQRRHSRRSGPSQAGHMHRCHKCFFKEGTLQRRRYTSSRMTIDGTTPIVFHCCGLY